MKSNLSKEEAFLTKNDPVLQKIIQTLPRPEWQSTHDVFHDLMSCIIEQQIHYRSTKKIFSKGLERAGISRLSLENFEFLEEHALSPLKLSMGKYETMKELMAYWNAHSPNFSVMSTDEVRIELASIKGIGKWTIDMILLYTLQRPDIFPYDDFHLKEIMIAEYVLDPKVKLKAQMLEIAEKWGEHTSLAVVYLLAWKNHLKKK